MIKIHIKTRKIGENKYSYDVVYEAKDSYETQLNDIEPISVYDLIKKGTPINDLDKNKWVRWNGEEWEDIKTP